MENTLENKKTLTFICPVCGTRELSYLLTAEDWLVSHEKFDIYACTNCGLRITYPRPKNLDNYYKSEDYVSHNEKARGLINMLFIIARSFTLRKKVHIVRKFASGKKLLDVGAGSGSFVAKALKAGYEAIGVEVNHSARRYCKEHHGIELYEPVVLNKMPDEEFDAITLWHVLEHIPDITSQMEIYFKLLRKRGVLILALPNFESYDAAFFKHHWAAWDVPRHLWHFSPAQIALLASRFNFTLEKTLPMPLDAYYISMLGFRNMKGNPQLLRSFLLSTWWNFCSIKTHRFSSLIYILRKP